MSDFTPTAEQISLHGLGFIQVKLPANRRMHVWHPDLPRRSCYAVSAIHNHRFSFRSTVLVGQQMNRRYVVAAAVDGSHDRISHDGPRSEKGGRLSYVAERVHVWPRSVESYSPGESYIMPVLEYHDTPNSGIVVTLMEKLREGTVHASSLIEHDCTFDQQFDRFQLSSDALWAIVVEALKYGAGVDMAKVLAA
ncbi:hypothetical protein [Sphingobium sp. YR768]|uniref:hypothetical protein n=1 Tax=Sphingobium sp. YR768 TaxID=1884365 RepID=UPI0008D33CBA|nr:hypothetical protein [Sphingobium sp. YR768]SEQ59981.1 hypothetical protein SAMN05518866_101475 [Sphingobium sp. YR768]